MNRSKGNSYVMYCTLSNWWLYKSVMKLYMHIYYIQSKPLTNFTIKVENINDIQDN
jgi:hypothetical protein